MKYVSVLVALLLLAGCGGVKKETPAPTPSPAPAGQGTQPQQAEVRGQVKKLQWPSPPKMQIDPSKSYTAIMKTSMGDIKIELFAKDAPKTVNNFVFLARQGYYDNVVFHRIVKDFMIQGGDPTGTGGGGPGYRFEDELPPKRSYDPGIVAMANAGPNTNGSQFFICNGKNCALSLNPRPNYNQFGMVVEGMDVVLKISDVPTVVQRGEKSKPTQEVWIKTVIIEEK